MNNKDIEHLNLLAIFYYVFAGIGALFSLFPVIHLVVGILMVAGIIKQNGDGTEIPAMMGGFFIFIALMIICLGLAMSTMMFLTGKYLKARENRTFCIVIAALLCASAPFGTVLGVFTIVVLCRDSVRALFDGNAYSQPGNFA